jgi:hypothetical protein
MPVSKFHNISLGELVEQRVIEILSRDLAKTLNESKVYERESCLA